MHNLLPDHAEQNMSAASICPLTDKLNGLFKFISWSGGTCQYSCPISTFFFQSLPCGGVPSPTLKGVLSHTIQTALVQAGWKQRSEQEVFNDPGWWGALSGGHQIQKVRSETGSDASNLFPECPASPAVSMAVSLDVCLTSLPTYKPPASLRHL